MNTDIDPLIRTAINILPEAAYIAGCGAASGVTIFWQIVLQVALIFFNAIFACG